jgi:regulatory protein
VARASRRPPAIDRAALERAALDYLARYASSSENLRRVLMRRIMRATQDRAARQAAAAIVAAIVAQYLASGVLDDALYAAQQAASLRRRGLSTEAIRARLREKGLARESIDATLATGPGDLAAACALVRRRRLGPFRAPEARAAARDRDLGALARAGFALDLARRVLAAKDEAALEQLLADAAADQGLSGR